MAHSMEMAWVVGYGVVTAPGVVAFCANAEPSHRLKNTAPATIPARLIILKFYQVVALLVGTLTARMRQTRRHRELVTGVVGVRTIVSTAPCGRTMRLTRDA